MCRHFMSLAEPILTLKGWEVIDWSQISSALTFDSATQSDGLHVAGPPMKIVVNMILHIFCNSKRN